MKKIATLHLQLVGKPAVDFLVPMCHRGTFFCYLLQLRR